MAAILTPMQQAGEDAGGAAHDQQLEQLLIAKNVRGMALLQPALQAGYLRRAALLLFQPGRKVLLTTGFPVVNSFESDGPIGALLIATMLRRCGVSCELVCGDPLAAVLANWQQKQNELALPVFPFSHLYTTPLGAVPATTVRAICNQTFAAALAIERPGKARDGQYYNMRGENISARLSDLDPLWQQLRCPKVAVGDGGNETGMGKIYHALQQLAIEPASSDCDELVLADVSNWAAYGFAYYWSLWSGEDLFQLLAPEPLLGVLLAGGCIDGVTRQPTYTEDGFALTEGLALCQQIYALYQKASTAAATEFAAVNTDQGFKHDHQQ